MNATARLTELRECVKGILGAEMADRERRDDALRLIEALQADLLEMSNAAIVPEGWQIVPKAATEEMRCATHDGPLCAGEHVMNESNRAWLGDMYAAMLESAPRPSLPTITGEEMRKLIRTRILERCAGGGDTIFVTRDPDIEDTSISWATDEEAAANIARFRYDLRSGKYQGARGLVFEWKEMPNGYTSAHPHLHYAATVFRSRRGDGWCYRINGRRGRDGLETKEVAMKQAEESIRDRVEQRATEARAFLGSESETQTTATEKAGFEA